MNEVKEGVAALLEAWAESSDGNRQGFIRLHEVLSGMEGIDLEFYSRPGLTSSLRALVVGQQRPLFAMIDVIEDEPRWLSVCFFNDMIQDPEERGAFVPGGLLGEDALCFDLEACTEEALAYVVARLEEARRSALAR
jgi:hypothetical protein